MEPANVTLRGYSAVFLVAVFLLACDLVQRLVVCPATRMAPSAGPRILGAWQRFLVRTVLFLVRRVGGAALPRPPSIPGEAGVLILMNHQSLLDIPLIIASLDGLYPRIVTRTRYAKRIPLISHTLRKFEYPMVEPGANECTARRYLDELGEVARTSEVPLALFPEGTRTRDGEIGHFRTTGLARILGARDWSVYLLVGDGYWQHAKFAHFLRGMSGIEGRLSLLGPFRWRDPDSDPGAFIGHMRELMVEELVRVRGAAPGMAGTALSGSRATATPSAL
jgi:1-acyl-sn-glycerol-3-phosphate acyltransferase